jgi:ABC-type transport system substrate-binding protein
MKLSFGKLIPESYRKIPSKDQWRNLFKTFSPKETIVFLVFLVIFLGSGILLGVNFYQAKTKIVPALGGTFREGIVGELKSINPLYLTTDPERDLAELLFSGLLSYDQNGKIVPDLAESYEIKDDGKTYEFLLRENLFWSDGEKLDANDVLWTIKALQNPDYKSPFLASWLDVNVEKEGTRLIRFKLKNPYYQFLELATVKIMPKHIWENVPPQNIHLSPFNLKPVSSGPYLVQHLKQDELGFIKELRLTKNKYFWRGEPLLEEFQIIFFNNQKELINAAFNKKIDGLAMNAPLLSLPGFNVYKTTLPRYFALFFNQDEKKLLDDLKIREAISLSIDKKTLLEKVFQNQGQVIESPLLPDLYGLEAPKEISNYDPQKAQFILNDAGFVFKEGWKNRVKIVKNENFEIKSDLKIGSQGKEVKMLQECLAKDPEIYPEKEITGIFGQKTKEAVMKFQEKYREEILVPQGLTKGTGEVKAATREKLKELCQKEPESIIPLKLELITVDQEAMKKTAELLKTQLEEVGFEIEIKSLPFSVLLKDYLKPRNYELLLFGQLLNMTLDLYPFWSSKQKKDPGLNLSNLENKELDDWLIKVRTSKNEEEFKKALAKIQDLILKEKPAVFLYNPDYFYLLSNSFKGFDRKILPDPSKRFLGVEKWYLKTKREWR